MDSLSVVGSHYSFQEPLDARLPSIGELLSSAGLRGAATGTPVPYFHHPAATCYSQTLAYPTALTQAGPYYGMYSGHRPYPEITTFMKPHHRTKRQRSSPAQLDVLEEQFLLNPMPSHLTRLELAVRLSMTPRRIQVWFQNKRAKVRRAIRNGEDVSILVPQSESDDSDNEAEKTTPVEPSGEQRREKLIDPR